MWRLPSLVGVRAVGRGEEDPHHVSAEGAVWSWGGEAPHRAPDHRGERENDALNAFQYTTNMQFIQTSQS